MGDPDTAENTRNSMKLVNNKIKIHHKKCRELQKKKKN